MELRELYIQLSQYEMLTDIEGYPVPFRKRFEESMQVVKDKILGDMIDDDIASSALKGGDNDQ